MDMTSSVGSIRISRLPPATEDLAVSPHNTNLALSDDGPYNNLGIETVWKRHDTVLVSDGGARFTPDPDRIPIGRGMHFAL